MAKKTFAHPALIDSSYVLFFHVLVVAWAFYFTSYFPEPAKDFSLLINILYPVTLFWFMYMIRQLDNVSFVLRLIVGYFFLSALFAVVSAVKGPLTDGELPVIQILFLGPYLVVSSHFSLIFASVVLFYAAVTYVSSTLSAILAEWLYESLFPEVAKKKLRRADKAIDSAAVKLSDKYFFMNQVTGVLIVMALLAVFSVVYLVGIFLF